MGGGREDYVSILGFDDVDQCITGFYCSRIVDGGDAGDAFLLSGNFEAGSADGVDVRPGAADDGDRSLAR